MADMKRVFEVTTAVSGVKTYLYAADGTEELGRPFKYHVTLLAEKELPLDDLLGKPITVSVEKVDGGSGRYFNGLVSQVAASGKRGQFHVVTATLRPWLWVLTRISDNKIFQNKTVTEIIQEVFDENGFSDYQMKVKASYRTRDYCVQYGESSFDFVSRLMEEEGIYYFFEHRDGKHDLVLYDAESTHNSCEVEGGDTLPFRLPGGHAIGVEHVNHWELSHALQTEAYVLDSYNFEKPKADLKQATKDAQQHGKPGLERYEYGQLYPEANDGGALVKVRCEEHLAVSPKRAKRSLLSDKMFCAPGAPGRIRTSDLRLRRALLYPTELRAHIKGPWNYTRLTEEISMKSILAKEGAQLSLRDFNA